MMVIDSHVHVAVHSDMPLPGRQEGLCTAEQLIEMYDSVGISRAVLLPLANPEPVQVPQSTVDVLDICARFPERFIPFCNIDPRGMYNTAQADFSGLLEYYVGRGCRGVGEVCANLPFLDPRVQNLFKHVDRLALPLTFHVAPREGDCYGLIDEIGLPGLEQSLARFPGITFLGHSPAFWSHISKDVKPENWHSYNRGPVAEGGRIPQLLRQFPNLYGDLSAGSGYGALSRDPEFAYAFLEEFQDRLLFGTDICLPSQRDSILVNLKRFLDQALADGNISRGVYEKVTFRNALNLLKL